jgi:transposase-like protein
MSDERIPARLVARMIGIKTATLAKWRRFGRGPRGWIEASPTLITYPAEEVARFIAARRSAEASSAEVADESLSRL